MAQGLRVGWCWGEKPESSPGQEAQCLAGFLGPAKEGAGALSYRGWLGEGRGSGEGGVGKSIEIGDSQQTGVHRIQPGRMTQGALGGVPGGGGAQGAQGTFVLSNPPSQARPPSGALSPYRAM